MTTKPTHSTLLHNTIARESFEKAFGHVDSLEKQQWAVVYDSAWNTQQKIIERMLATLKHSLKVEKAHKEDIINGDYNDAAGLDACNQNIELYQEAIALAEKGIEN